MQVSFKYNGCAHHLNVSAVMQETGQSPDCLLLPSNWLVLSSGFIIPAAQSSDIASVSGAAGHSSIAEDHSLQLPFVHLQRGTQPYTILPYRYGPLHVVMLLRPGSQVSASLLQTLVGALSPKCRDLQSLLQSEVSTATQWHIQGCRCALSPLNGISVPWVAFSSTAVAIVSPENPETPMPGHFTRLRSVIVRIAVG